MKAMNAAIIEIKNDKIHGASYLTDKALEAIENGVQTIQAPNSEKYLREISEFTSALMECRPTMASIGNCSSWFMIELQKYAAAGPDLNSLREFSLLILLNIRDNMARARTKTIEAGAGLIANGNIIITCSYSSTIVQAMVCAHDQGKSFHILISRSQEFPEEFAYGEKMASELSGQGIECQVFSDGDIREKVRQADKIIVGADAILLDGSLLNGYPTAALALAAGDANVPFYTVCESHKYLCRDIPETIEKGFNLVPSRLITGIATEKGIITSNQMHHLID